MNLTKNLVVTKTSQSRLSSVNFEELSFGEIFTDHMFVCDFKKGSWQTPEILPYQNISMAPSASALHYGQAVFEGMKAYKDDADQLWLFRPELNFERINKSSKRLGMPEFPKEFFFQGLDALLELDSEWVKPGLGNSLYVRPFVFASQACVQASPSLEYKFMIICSPVKAYYSGNELNVLIEKKYSRAASGGVGYAKAAGNYAAQFYPTAQAMKKGYQQIIWTDSSTHSYLEEAGTMNIFFRIEDKLITAPIGDTILDGITRKSVIEWARHQGITVEERPVAITEIIEAAESGRLKEIFGSGTAVVISPINGFAFEGTDYRLPQVQDSFASQAKKAITSIQYNLIEDSFGWRYKVG
ncbi:MAG: branched-chain amino acid aminotransferase [Flavobacteriaceae bacterium]